MSEHDSTVEGFRARISEQDRAIVAAANARLELVRGLKAYKDANGIGFLDPDRERRLVEELQATSAGPLSDDGVRELVEQVLALTKRELER